MPANGPKAILGRGLGGPPSVENTTEHPAPRFTVTYECDRSHLTSLTFAEGAEVPDTWACHCGHGAWRDGIRVPLPAPTGGKGSPLPGKTHYEHVLERRTRDELAVLLEERLAELRRLRKAG